MSLKQKLEFLEDDDDPGAAHQIYDLTPLTSLCEAINWHKSYVNFPGLTRVRAPRGNNAFYHCFLNSFFLPYRTRVLNTIQLQPANIIRMVRMELATKLGEPDDGGVTPYDRLASGVLTACGRHDRSSCSLPDAQRSLLQDMFPATYLLEFLCDEFQKDLYLISGTTRDVYPVVDPQYLVKKRPAVVVLFMGNHFEQIVVEDKDGTQHTLFGPENKFIMKLLKRIESHMV